MEIKNENIVCCPCSDCDMYRCNLHQIGYEIFDRSEDDPIGTHIIIDGNGKTIVSQDELKNNPSSRRDGIKIKFYCEQRDKLPPLFLNIWQHKGNTYQCWTTEINGEDIYIP